MWQASGRWLSSVPLTRRARRGSVARVRRASMKRDELAAREHEAAKLVRLDGHEIWDIPPRSRVGPREFVYGKRGWGWRKGEGWTVSSPETLRFPISCFP
jgi:hypothetical protein